MSRVSGRRLTYEHIVARILRDRCFVTVVTAPAGFGKTWLLKSLRQTLESVGSDSSLWTIADGAGEALIACRNLDMLGSGRRCAIALRPGETVTGLDRLRLYGDVLDLTGDDLLFTRDDLSPWAWDKCAGWPVLMGRDWQALEEGVIGGWLVNFLAEECLADIEESELCALLLLQGEPPPWLVARLPPLAHPQTAACRLVHEALIKAVEQRLLLRRASGGLAADLSPRAVQVLQQRPHHLEAILSRLMAQGLSDEALALFCRAGGWFLYYRLGHAAFLRLVLSLEAVFEDQPEELAISRSFVMIKAGDVGSAMQFLVRRFGAEMRDVPTVLSAASELSLRVKLFRVTVLIYEDVTPTDRLLEALFDIGQHLPLDAPEQRGSFYNSMLEFFLRLRRYEEADGVAEKAMAAYLEADCPILCFYIALHQSVLSLLTSDLDRMARSLQHASAMLAKVGYDSPGDRRLHDLLKACLAYEQGEPEALLAFLDCEMAALLEGEMWPSIADIVIYYGSHALSVHMSTRAALRFLDRWKVYQPLNRQFRLALEVRKAQVLQNGNGWGDAARLLTPLRASFDLVWIESAQDALSRLGARTDIALALSFLRQIAYERPTFLHLDRKLEAMLANPHLMARQEIAATIWLAFVCRHTQQNSRARNLLRRVFELCASHGGLTALAEESLFLDQLLQDRRMAEFVMAATPARAILRRLDKGRLSRLANARSRLTQQELKILMMLAEGASNKLIARNGGIAEPTVKFHLKNVYRKLGCSRRHEAIATARALGWVR